MSGRRGGFTLAEALVALTISSVVVVLVAGVFLVQNQFHALQLQRVTAHDNARMATEAVATDLRSMMPGGFVVAEDRRLVVRVPMVVGAVCLQTSRNRVTAHFEGATEQLNTAEVSGFAVRNPSTGAWSYHDIAGWSAIQHPGGRPARDCARSGADTLSATGDFVGLRRLDDYLGFSPDVGDAVLLYRTVEYRFRESVMDPPRIGLFRGPAGDPLVEYVSGMDPAAQFGYRTGGSAYQDVVSGASLGLIDAVRIVAQARQQAETGGREDVSYGWAVNVFMRNGA